MLDHKPNPDLAQEIRDLHAAVCDLQARRYADEHRWEQWDTWGAAVVAFGALAIIWFFATSALITHTLSLVSRR